MTWYTGDPVFDTILLLGFVFSLVVIVFAVLAPSPYGRFASEQSGGINVNPKLGWWLMEIPATVVFLVFFIWNYPHWNATALVLGAIWLIHYGNRGWFFPLTIRVSKDRRATFSAQVMGMGMFVTAIHGYLNATWFTTHGDLLTNAWLTDPRFIVGVIVYAFGLGLTLHSESVLRNLRPRHPRPGASSTYKIPYGGGFRWVTSPQYLGEMIAWIGFAVFTWGLPGVLIFVITAGNLVPRAVATHRWYKEQFNAYPAQRKALIPFVF